MIRAVQLKDADAISSIYNYYIESSNITFEEDPLSVEDMKRRIENITSKFPFLVYEARGEIIGYAYANTWKSRSAYRYSVESTIYLKHGLSRKGIGAMLYTDLINELKSLGIHSVIGGIAIPNPGSIRLHEKLGFTKLGQFHEVGYKNKEWIDVGYWELLLK